MLAIRMLGAPLVTIAGAAPPAEFLWRKNLGLCLLMWLSSERRISRDRAMATLWADKPERAARHSLNEALRVIRRVAGDDALESAGEQLCWHGELSCDIDRFDSLARADVIAAARSIGGELCEGFSIPEAPAFDDWMAAERRGWQGRCVTVLTQAARQRDALGDSLAALEFGTLALRLDPFSDTAAQAAIRSRWLTGDRGGAIALGHLFRERLSDALGATPEASTVALLADLARAARPKVAPPVVAMRRPPLIGRSESLDTVMSAWHEAVHSREAAIAIVEGRPGAGGTRMLEEATARAALEGGTTVLIRAVDADADVAEEGLFALLHGAMLELPGVGAAPPTALAAFAARRPEWADRYPGTTMLTGLPLNDAIAAVLRVSAEERPILLAIDDIARVSAATRVALPALLRSLSTAPFLLLLSISTLDTDTPTEGLRRAAGREGRGRIAQLPEWTTPDLAELVAFRHPGWEPDARHRLARRLTAESGGMPAIAVELLEGVSRGLSLDVSAPVWPDADRTMDQTLPSPMPASLVASLRLSFRALDPGQQQLLTTASLLPEPFLAHTIQELCPELTVPELLDVLEWQCWLVADARGYAFRARAIRRMIGNEMLTPGQRRRLEQRIQEG